MTAPLELVDVDEQRAAWLEARRAGVGASEVAAICGVPGAYGSAWSVWVDKVGLAPLDSPPTPAMQLGLDLEPVIAEWFHRETGLELGGEQEFRRHQRAPHHVATVDRLAFDGPGRTSEDALGPVELKYSSQALDGLPEPWRYQVNWQMHVTGLEHGWLAALTFPFGRPAFHVFELELDRDLVRRAVDVVDTFWHDHVVPRLPPFEVDASSATADAIAAAWGHRSTIKVPTVELDDLADLVGEWRDLDRKAKALAELVDYRKNRGSPRVRRRRTRRRRRRARTERGHYRRRARRHVAFG